MRRIGSEPLHDRQTPRHFKLDSACSPSSSSAAACRLLWGVARSCWEAAPKRGPVRYPIPCCSATLEEATLPALQHRCLVPNCTTEWCMHEVVPIAPRLCPAELCRSCQKLDLQVNMDVGRLQAAGCIGGHRPGQHPRLWASECIRGTDLPK